MRGFEAFRAATRAYIEVCNFPSDRSLIPVEKTPENEFQYKLIKENFPNSKMIHMVRDPIINLASCKRNAINLNYNFNLLTSFRSIIMSMHTAENNSKENEDYLCVKYEKLIKNPKDEMKNIANFLEIEYNDSLLSTTYLGEKIKSNSMYDKHYNKSEIYNRDYDLDWNESFNEFSLEEKNLLINIFQDENLARLIEKYGYKNKFKR